MTSVQDDPRAREQRHPRALAVAMLVALLATGCATTPASSSAQGGSRARDARDPLERVNRATYRFNDALDKAIVRPIARGYRRVAPQVVETGISNFFANAKYPTVIVNNALQGKLATAGADTARLLINSTLGIGGLFDPATRMGLDAHDEDFGQTLGRWGVPPGPYLVVPVLGPYTLRDGVGSLADDFVEPRHYLEDDSTRYLLWAADRLETRARLLDAEVVLERAGDPYAFVRSAYLQRREFLVRDGEVPADEAPLEDPGLEDPELEDRALEDAKTDDAGSDDAGPNKPGPNKPSPDEPGRQGSQPAGVSQSLAPAPSPAPPPQ
jgi:phospholipid-binding lipoprotein MlaA